VNSIAKQWNNDGDMNFFLLEDPNVVYTFHFYEPFAYTHQLDMLDLMDQHGLSFAYHAYHEDGFGIYRGGGPVDPARANQDLIALFTRKLARP
jgi:hypothetical protein